MKSKLIVVISALFPSLCWAQFPIVSMAFTPPTGVNQEAMICSKVTLSFYDYTGHLDGSYEPFYLDVYLPPGLEAFDNSSCSGTPDPMTTPQRVEAHVTQLVFSVRSYSPIADWLIVTNPLPLEAKLPINIYHIPPKGISFAAVPFNQPVGLCATFPFEFLGRRGLAVVVRDPHRVELIEPAAPQTNVFSDNACQDPLVEMTVPAGQRGGTLYVRINSESEVNVPIQIQDIDADFRAQATARFDEIRYTDVGVIININSDDSMSIGQYFAEKREIPLENMFYIDAPVSEFIDKYQFNSIRSQLEIQLLSQDPQRKLNYLVTTKGFPLAIDRHDYNGNLPTSASASVESEIALLLSAQAGLIGGAGPAGNPYYAGSPYYPSAAPFKRGATGSFLVTRLDAYTVDQVYDLINRGGQAIPVTKATSLFVLDQDPHRTSSLNTQLSLANDILSGRGYSTELNTDDVYVTDRRNVLGYTSWGSNDWAFRPLYEGPSLPNFQWLPGSIAETYVSTSARSFMPGTPYGQSLVADLLSEGVGGVKGYVFEPFVPAIAIMSIVFDRYTRGYNLAESFASGSEWLYSWMDVIVGDPKMSILP
jgi:uncharacterized protein (TIGR03790 family)